MNISWKNLQHYKGFRKKILKRSYLLPLLLFYIQGFTQFLTITSLLIGILSFLFYFWPPNRVASTLDN